MAKFINILCDLELQLETVSHAYGLIGFDPGPAGLQTCSTILHKELN